MCKQNILSFTKMLRCPVMCMYKNKLVAPSVTGFDLFIFSG